VSPTLIKNHEGRLAHFRHLHKLLLDPVMITTREKIETEFEVNDGILNVISAEDIEGLKQLQSEKAERLTKSHATDDRVGATNINGASVNGIKDNQDCKRNDDDIATLVLTSGRTGNAKAVCLTHKQVFAAIIGKQCAMESSPGTSLLNWIGIDHVASLIEIHLCALYTNLAQVHVPASVLLASPLLFLHLLSQHRVGRTFAPNFFLTKLKTALDATSEAEKRTFDLSSIPLLPAASQIV